MFGTGCSCGASELSLERTPEHFWLQRAAFSHPDLHDEMITDLVELSSPFSHVGDDGNTVCYTFLLL